MLFLRDLCLASAAGVALYWTVFMFPITAPAVIWLVHLPGLLFAARHPATTPVWAAVTAAVLMALTGAESAAAFAATVGLATLVIAFGLTRSWSLERTIVTALVLWLSGTAALLVLGTGGVGEAAAEARAQLEQAFSMALEASRAAGAEANAIELLANERAAVVQSVLQVLPALASLTGGAILCVSIAIARRFVPMFEGFSLRYWRAPDMLIWAFIASGFLMLAPVGGLDLVAANAFVFLLGCYFLQGLAVVTYYLDRFRLPVPLRVGTYALIGIQQLLAAAVLALGIFDLWGDFRRLHRGAADASAGADGD